MAHLHLPSLEAQSISAPASLQSPQSDTAADPRALQVDSVQKYQCEQQRQSQWAVSIVVFRSCKQNSEYVVESENNWMATSSFLAVMKIPPACNRPGELLQVDELQKYVAYFLETKKHGSEVHLHGTKIRIIWTCSEKLCQIG